MNYRCHEQGPRLGPRTHRGGCGSGFVPTSPAVPRLGLRLGCSWGGVSSSDGSKIQTWRGNTGHWERCLAQLKDFLFSTGCSQFISSFLTIFVLGIFFISQCLTWKLLYFQSYRELIKIFYKFISRCAFSPLQSIILFPAGQINSLMQV